MDIDIPIIIILLLNFVLLCTLEITDHTMLWGIMQYSSKYNDAMDLVSETHCGLPMEPWLVFACVCLSFGKLTVLNVMLNELLAVAVCSVPMDVETAITGFV